MKITIIAPGKIKNSQFFPLFEEYRKRMITDIKVIEIHISSGRQQQNKEIECRQIEMAIPNHSAIIALDERGDQLSSVEFATKLGQLRSQISPHLCFIIGGADGLSDAIRKKANFVMSLGRMTWPHLFVRVLLAEQLYRAYTIEKGHPYHRE